jgi:hypothetical protein
VRACLAALLVLGLAATAAAQAVDNPTTVQFVPSADHNAVTPIGLQPVVVRYDLVFYRASDLNTPAQVVNLGKPAIGSDGTIQVEFSALLTWPLPDGTYQARVVAIGQSGSGVSDWSNVFTFGGGGGGDVTGPPPMAPSGGALHW